MATQSRHRVHPITPILASFHIIVVSIGFIAFNMLELIKMVYFWVEYYPLMGMLAIFAGLVVFLAAVMALSWLSWRFRFYELTDEEIRIGSGWLVRTRRNARFDRVQAVDINQPLLARIAGLAELKIETAGGDNSDLTIRYLTLEKSRELRQEILRATNAAPHGDADSAVGITGDTDSAGEIAGDTDGAVAVAGEITGTPAGHQQETLHGPTDPVRLALSMVLGPIVLLGALLLLTLITAGGAAVVFAARKMSLLAALGGAGLSLAIALAAIGSFLGVVALIIGGTWASSYGFTLTADDTDQRLKVRAGLLSTRRQTIPIRRIHGFCITRPLWWRGPKWSKARMSVAGYGVETAPTTNLIPVDSDSAVDATVDAIVDRISGTPRANTTADTVFASPSQARWVSPIDWRQQTVRVGPRALTVTTGRLWHNLHIVPWDRIQGVTTMTDPISNALGVMTVRIDMVEGPVKPIAKQLSVADARRLVTIINQRRVR